MLPQVPSTLYPVPSAPDAPVEEQARAAKKVKVSAFGRPCFLSCVNFKIQNTDLELEDGAWQRALEKWYFMLTLDASVSLVGSSLAGLNLSESMQALRELFGRKSEATVSKRASALIRYVKFLRGCEPACNPFPFSTEKADVYMRFLKSNQAKPGAVDAFTEAVKFAIHVVGISCQGEPSKIFSPWSIGFRGLMQCKKRERVPAKVLQVDQVKHLESLLDEPDVDIKDRYACGAFLFCIFSRSRISDIRDVFGFLVDTVEVGGELKGFIECRTRSHKTAKQASVQGVAMPLVAPVNGVSADPSLCV